MNFILRLYSVKNKYVPHINNSPPPEHQQPPPGGGAPKFGNLCYIAFVDYSSNIYYRMQ
jgi:hypothetical protein